MAEVEQTTLRRSWRNKMLIICVVLIAFGGWGLLDAVWIYPARGEKVAELREYQHLKQVKEQWSGARLRANDAGVADPAERLDELRDIKRERALEGREASEEAWLIALSRIGRLTPDATTYTDGDALRDPNTRLDELSTKWSTITNQPKPLSSYDIPVQWVIMAVAWGFAAYIIFLMVRTASKKWTWQPDTMTLKMPGGHEIAPSDLEDIDKRKWSKYYVSLIVKPEHASLGGQAVEVDLYRRSKIESWVLAMEAKAFPDRADQAGATTPEQPAAANEPTGEETDSSD